MTATIYTRDQFEAILRELMGEDDVSQPLTTIQVWLDRGDGVAVYQNQDLGHPDLGHIQIMSYGSPAAQLEMPYPPEVLPDIGSQINWRYTLQGVFGGPAQR